ncbi:MULTISPECIES: hypothetical protein [Shewanella]|uniref:Uncharacterized protein n=1 Tax=Shewanella marisflavi TaxID=260364 RepID=A0ABX5WN35_9GAMM|nr:MULTISPECIES: hypothetical protein [Shewanella]QDF75930.1 hypothetical protein FGA12_12680 [Shewanella marisflavi]
MKTCEIRRQQQSEELDCVIDFLARAIADSYYIRPRWWLAKYGGLLHCGYLPAQHAHLYSDYKEVLREMQSKVKAHKSDIGLKPDFAVNIRNPFTQ